MSEILLYLNEEQYLYSKKWWAIVLGFVLTATQGSAKTSTLVLNARTDTKSHILLWNSYRRMHVLCAQAYIKSPQAFVKFAASSLGSHLKRRRKFYPVRNANKKTISSILPACIAMRISSRLRKRIVRYVQGKSRLSFMMLTTPAACWAMKWCLRRKISTKLSWRD